MMKTNVFLDLEETVIDSWDSGFPINTLKVKNFLRRMNCIEVGIFSFAIWNDKDKKDFDSRLKPFLEIHLGVKIIDAPSVEEVMEMDTRLTGVRFDSITDFVSIRGKMGAFNAFCKTKFETNSISTLLDDVVPNMVISDSDNNTIIQFVNVVKLQESV